MAKNKLQQLQQQEAQNVASQQQTAALPPPPPSPIGHGGIGVGSSTTGKSPTGFVPPAVPGASSPTSPPPPGFTSWDQYYQYLNALNASATAGAAGSASTAAADLAEKRREFDITTQRDIAKENASEVDALQKMLAGLSGPKDVYADLFFSHGLLPPQGYKPAPVPLTDAQKAAYAGMGVTPDQLQQMIIGTGKPGADVGQLGSLGASLQPQAGMPGYQSAPAPTGAQAASNPTVQGGALYGKAPAGTTVAGPAAPQTPAMATGGQVPGQVGDPRLIVAHGGEEVDNNTPQGPIAPVNNQGVHPAIQRLMDALSELLADPDFKQFAGIAGKAAAIGKAGSKGKPAKGKAPKEGSPEEEAAESPMQEAMEQSPMQGPMAQMAPGPQVTPGGVQSMAVGGSVEGGAGLGARGISPALSPSPPIQPTPVPSGYPAGASPRNLAGAVGGGPRSVPNFGPSPVPAAGLPMAGQQGVIHNTGSSQPADNPIMPLANMDPYTRALYDVHGRLHPYSAQQLAQMGPQGQQAVESYVGKVEGADVNAYTDLAKRLMPIGSAPTASTGTASEGFSFG